MVIGVARGGLTRRKQFNYIFTANASNQTLRTVVDNAGYSGSGDVVVTINSGVHIFSTSTGSAALVPGSFPSGVTVTLINNGYISGAGGAGATAYRDYQGGTPIAAGAGGTALSASGISGFTFKVDNGSGTIRGGGGGGGYGGGSTNPYGNDYFDERSGGGGGGGGQGHNGGAAGGGGSIGGTPPSWADGSAGSINSAGSGGTGTTNNNGIKAGNGGAGGSWGSSGSSGSDPVTPQGAAVVGSTGAGGGADGGNAVTGTSNITWIATGTRTGTVS